MASTKVPTDDVNRQDSRASAYRLTPADIAKFWKRVIIAGPDDCWLWRGNSLRSTSGYTTIQFGAKNPRLYAHRVSAQIAGQDTNGRTVRHTCDNTGCVNPNHLIAGTQGENLDDMTEKGRRAVGSSVGSPLESNPNAKLTMAEARRIRELARSGLTYKQLGERFGVHLSTIGDIVRGERWPE